MSVNDKSAQKMVRSNSFYLSSFYPFKPSRRRLKARIGKRITTGESRVPEEKDSKDCSNMPHSLVDECLVSTH